MSSESETECWIQIGKGIYLKSKGREPKSSIEIASLLENYAGIIAPPIGSNKSTPLWRIAKAFDIVSPHLSGPRIHANGKMTRATKLKPNVKKRARAKRRRDSATSSNQNHITREEAQTFYDSYGWRKLRYETLKRYGKKCMCCSAIDVQMHVDHIKPLRLFWSLRLDPDNVQVLCHECNHGKGNWDTTDWRS